MRSNLFHISERYSVPISSFAIPSDVSILGPSFGDQSYYADFAGIAKKYKPTDILEIGVRFGYSAVAMILGTMAAGIAAPDYIGFDAEFFGVPEGITINAYDSGKPEQRGSHALAARNLREQVPGAGFRLWSWDTRNGWPEEFEAHLRGFDLINVDGDHSYEGAYGDLSRVWPLCQPGGIVIVDDLGMTDVRRAAEHFRDERESRGELAGYQRYENERGFAIFQKK